MFRFLTNLWKKRRGKRTVGWFLTPETAGFIWAAPRPVSRPPVEDMSLKSVLHCPAVLDLESRLFEIPCPVDIHIRLVRDQTRDFMIMPLAGPREATLVPNQLQKLCVLTPPGNWRHPDRPIVQIQTPYRFISDDPIYLNQLPAFGFFHRSPLPGTLVSGRFPADIWPRPMMYALEWWDLDRDLILKRGDPWFYVRFDTDDPRGPVRMVEAMPTPELLEFCTGVDGVTNFINRTFSLFSTARARRPKRLLVERKR